MFLRHHDLPIPELPLSGVQFCPGHHMVWKHRRRLLGIMSNEIRLANLTEASQLIDYICMCITYLFFYRALKVQGWDRKDLPVYSSLFILLEPLLTVDSTLDGLNHTVHGLDS